MSTPKPVASGQLRQGSGTVCEGAAAPAAGLVADLLLLACVPGRPSKQAPLNDSPPLSPPDAHFPHAKVLIGQAPATGAGKRP